MAATDTIYALSSGKLPSGIAVYRISGPESRFVLETICGEVPSARVMRKVSIRGLNGDLIDRGLCVFFPGPASFTGEDSVELHVHGSLAVSKRLSSELSAIQGVRPAEAGEFAKRSFLNGKLDLAEAEGLADLITAETEGQRRLALVQAEGGLSRVYAGWREQVLYSRAMIEAAIDFADEDEVESQALDAIVTDLTRLRSEIMSWLQRSSASDIVRDGFKVVIIGPPNAGKSSLLNMLAGREAAIITDEPGTTRDLIDVRLELGGNLVIVTDTAGIRDDAGKVEAIGIERALKRAESADLVLLLEDASLRPAGGIELSSANVVRVGNKADVAVLVPDRFNILLSALSGAGVDALVDYIAQCAIAASGENELMIMQDRQKQLLFNCCDHLHEALSSMNDLELAGEALRLGSDCIGRLTGRVDVEELLGVIFSRFCIGK